MQNVSKLPSRCSIHFTRLHLKRLSKGIQMRSSALATCRTPVKVLNKITTRQHSGISRQQYMEMQRRSTILVSCSTAIKSQHHHQAPPSLESCRPLAKLPGSTTKTGAVLASSFFFSQFVFIFYLLTPEYPPYSTLISTRALH